MLSYPWNRLFAYEHCACIVFPAPRRHISPVREVNELFVSAVVVVFNMAQSSRAKPSPTECHHSRLAIFSVPRSSRTGKSLVLWSSLNWLPLSQLIIIARRRRRRSNKLLVCESLFASFIKRTSSLAVCFDHSTRWPWSSWRRNMAR